MESSEHVTVQRGLSNSTLGGLGLGIQSSRLGSGARRLRWQGGSPFVSQDLSFPLWKVKTWTGSNLFGGGRGRDLLCSEYPPWDVQQTFNKRATVYKFSSEGSA